MSTYTDAVLSALLQRIDVVADVTFTKERSAVFIYDASGWTAEVFQVQRGKEAARWYAHGETADEATTKLSEGT